jgi:two-component system cell cycle sensor histidine kinase/response regulator CckA
MTESPNRMCRALTWTGMLSLLGIEKKLPQNAPARSEESLLQSQKMEAIGRLAGGIAHDFNNLLAVITGYSDLLLESLASDLDRRKVEQIKQAANSAATCA